MCRPTDYPPYEDKPICMECKGEIERESKTLVIEGKKVLFHLWCSELAVIKLLAYKPSIGAN